MIYPGIHKRSTIGHLDLEAATPKNDLQYTLSNIIHMKF